MPQGSYSSGRRPPGRSPYAGSRPSKLSTSHQQRPAPAPRLQNRNNLVIIYVLILLMFDETKLKIKSIIILYDCFFLGRRHQFQPPFENQSSQLQALAHHPQLRAMYTNLRNQA